MARGPKGGENVSVQYKVLVGILTLQSDSIAFDGLDSIVRDDCLTALEYGRYADLLPLNGHLR